MIKFRSHGSHTSIREKPTKTIRVLREILPSGRCNRPLIFLSLVAVVLLIPSGCLSSRLSGELVTETPAAVNGDVQPESTIEPSQTATAPNNQTGSSSETPAEITGKLLDSTEVHPRDLLNLAQRLKGVETSGKVPVVGQHEPFKVGQVDRFWVANQDGTPSSQMNATLRIVTPHAYFYIADGAKVDQSALEQASQVFENEIYPTDHKYFGSEWSPGIDNDVHITVLNLPSSGYGGFFSSADEFPRSVNPYSNEREIIYISLNSFPVGSNGYLTALAHEFQHMIAWNQKQRGEAWVEEGMAVTASRLAGYPGAEEVQAFTSNPDTQLNTWSDGSDVRRHYGASFLFMDYLAQRFGDPGILGTLLGEPEDSFQAIDAALATRESNLTVQGLFKDWLIANYLDNTSIADGRYGYRDLDAHVALKDDIKGTSVNKEGSVRQYAADYIGIEPGGQDFTLTITGTNTTPLLPVSPHSGGKFWWSNRGDDMDTSLTRTFDLSNLTTATLDFWTWYDIEKDFDYAYVEVSTDGGYSWQILKGNHLSDSNPNGNNFGYGFTGTSNVSSAGWEEERLDLSQYAGEKILLRFEYVTDEAYNGNGFALDDISIPELGFKDDAEGANEWVADGFVQVYDSVPQKYLVQLITFGKNVEVKDVPLDKENRGEMSLSGQDVKRAVIVVSGQAPKTLQEANYNLGVKYGSK